MSSPEPITPTKPPQDLRPVVIVLVGPTAVGKTELAILLAGRLNGEVISADSRLFYRGMDIGTAKPSIQERTLIPHHLVDIREPNETFSLAAFQQAARQAIAEIHARGALPILVGGTGQYIHAVIHGWRPPAVLPNERLRAELARQATEKGAEWLHRQLGIADPAAAESIDGRNVRRVIRALEVIFTSGVPFSSQREAGASPYRVLTIGLSRERSDLYARIDARIEAMFAAGFLDEVRRLLDKGYSAQLPAMTSIGYREAVAVLQGNMELEEAKVRMRRLTRNFVRRQANWFKLTDPAIHWFQADQEPLQGIEMLVKDWLKRESPFRLSSRQAGD